MAEGASGRRRESRRRSDRKRSPDAAGATRQSVTPAVDRTRMARLVQDENVLLRDFVALLGQEQALLLEGDVDALMALAGQRPSSSGGCNSPPTNGPACSPQRGSSPTPQSCRRSSRAMLRRLRTGRNRLSSLPRRAAATTSMGNSSPAHAAQPAGAGGVAGSRRAARRHLRPGRTIAPASGGPALRQRLKRLCSPSPLQERRGAGAPPPSRPQAVRCAPQPTPDRPRPEQHCPNARDVFSNPALTPAPLPDTAAQAAKALAMLSVTYHGKAMRCRIDAHLQGSRPGSP